MGKTIRVYVAGLISRNDEFKPANVLEFLKNIRRGQKFCLELIKDGFAVFCPFQDYQYALLEDQQLTKEQYYRNSMAWLEVSDLVLVLSGAGSGGGVDKEIKQARKMGIPVKIVENSLNRKEE